MGFIVTRYRLLIFLCFIHYNVTSHLVHSSHRFPDLFKTDRDEGAKTRVPEGTQTSRRSIKSGHDWRSSDAFMAGQSGDASSETHSDNLAWKDSVERRLRDLEMGSRSFPEEQAEPEVKREIDTCGGEIKRLTGEVIQVRRELEAAKTELKDVKNALTTINSDREAQIDKHMTAHGTQESITNPHGHVTDDDLKAFKDAHGELKTHLDYQDETIVNLNKTEGNGVMELKKELHTQVSREQEDSTKLHVIMDHLMHDTIFENLKVAIDSQYRSTASPNKRRRRRDGFGALTTAMASFMSELQNYNKTIQDGKTELMKMSQDAVTGNDVVKLEKCQTDVRTLAQNLAKTEKVLDFLQVGLREEKRFVRSHFDAFKDSLNSFINQRDLLETNLTETTDILASVSDALSNVIMEVDSVNTSIWTFRDKYISSTNAQIEKTKDDVDTLKMLHNRNLDGGWSLWQPWGTCSKSCGVGLKTRLRTCSSPSSSHQGRQCLGDDRQSDVCTLQTCAVDGGWSVWQPWGTCSKSCGVGLKTRMRTCSSPSPSHQGRQCLGDDHQSDVCTLQTCAVDGGWSVWQRWGTCSTSCGVGLKTRMRTCSSPTPSHQGRQCLGDARQSDVCTEPTCPTVNGGWSAWQPWGICGGGGIKQRIRDCNNPAPDNEGRECLGNNLDISSCTPTAASVRLVNGTNANEGRIEVSHNGVWGTVCDDYWSKQDAQVVCRLLGKPYTNAVAYEGAHFGQGSGSILMDDVQCTGTETHLFDCPFRVWARHNCGHNEDAGVSCQ